MVEVADEARAIAKSADCRVLSCRATVAHVLFHNCVNHSQALWGKYLEGLCEFEVSAKHRFSLFWEGVVVALGNGHVEMDQWIIVWFLKPKLIYERLGRNWGFFIGAKVTHISERALKDKANFRH